MQNSKSGSNCQKKICKKIISPNMWNDLSDKLNYPE
uniref:Uncharacterized protein n=1 Tax=Arundo donax TaxID=35708 RepID=A0A0A9BPF9_ARUDO